MITNNISKLKQSDLHNPSFTVPLASVSRRTKYRTHETIKQIAALVTISPNAKCNSNHLQRVRIYILTIGTVYRALGRSGAQPDGTDKFILWCTILVRK